MKKRFVWLVIGMLTLAAAFTMNAFAEDPSDQAATKLEQLLITKGSLVVKEFYAGEDFSIVMGAVRLSIEGIVAYEPGKQNQALKGIRLVVTENASKIVTTRVGFLDMEEIPSASNAIKYMLKQMEEWKGSKRTYTEIVYSSKGNVEIGVLQDGKDQRGWVECGYVTPVTFTVMNMKTMNEIARAIDSMNDLLMSK